MRADVRPIDKPFVPKGPRTGALEMQLPQLVACTLFTPFLPRFHPDGTYQPFLPLFYPVLEGKMRRGKKEGKKGVNPLYPGVKTG